MTNISILPYRRPKKARLTYTRCRLLELDKLRAEERPDYPTEGPFFRYKRELYDLSQAERSPWERWPYLFAFMAWGGVVARIAPDGISVHVTYWKSWA